MIAAFASTAFSLEILQCKMTNMDWGGLGSLMTCDVTGPSVYSPTSITGGHFFLLMVYSQAAAFRKQHAGWTYIPNGIGKIMPNIRTFQVMQSNVKKISRENFAGLSKLTDMNLWSNEIATIDEDTFSDLSNLEGLYLSKNKITKIQVNLLSNLYKLVVLDLFDNQIESLPRGIFRNNNKLTNLRFENNKIKSIMCESFDNMVNLKTLDFKGNVCVNKKYEGYNLIDLKSKLKNDLSKCNPVCEDYLAAEREIERLEKELKELGGV